MAYGLKYRNYFKNRQGENILLYIEGDGYTGAVETMRFRSDNGNPIEIEWLAKEELDVVRPSVMTIKAFADENDPIDKYSELFEGKQFNKWRVTLYRGVTIRNGVVSGISVDKIIFRGLINPTTQTMPLTLKPRTITIPVGDALSSLKNRNYFTRLDGDADTKATTQEREIDHKEFTRRQVVTALFYDMQLGLNNIYRTDEQHSEITSTITRAMVPRWFMKDHEHPEEPNRYRNGADILADIFPNYYIRQVGHRIYFDKITHTTRASTLQAIEFNASGNQLWQGTEVNSIITLDPSGDSYFNTVPTYKTERNTIKELQLSATVSIADLVAYKDYGDNVVSSSNTVLEGIDRWCTDSSSTYQTTTWQDNGFDIAPTGSWSFTTSNPARQVAYHGYFSSDYGSTNFNVSAVISKIPKYAQLSQAVEVYFTIGFREQNGTTDRWYWVGGTPDSPTFRKNGTYDYPEVRCKVHDATLEPYTSKINKVSATFNLEQLVDEAQNYYGSPSDYPDFNHGQLIEFYIGFDPVLRTTGGNTYLDTSYRDISVTATSDYVETSRSATISIDDTNEEIKELSLPIVQAPDNVVGLLNNTNAQNAWYAVYGGVGSSVYPNVELRGYWFDSVLSEDGEFDYLNYIANDLATLYQEPQRTVTGQVRSVVFLKPTALYDVGLKEGYILNGLRYNVREDVYQTEFGSVNDSPIAAEANLTFTPTSIDFGTMGATDVKIADLRVHNNGPLSGTFTVEQSGDVDQIYLQNDTFTIGPYETVTLYVEAATTKSNGDNEGATVSTTFTIGTSTCDAEAEYGTYSYTLTPSSGPIDFPDVTLGHRYAEWVDIENTGTASVVLTSYMTHGNRGFSTSAAQLIIAPGQTLSRSCLFDATVAGNFTDTFNLVDQIDGTETSYVVNATAIDEPENFKEATGLAELIFGYVAVGSTGLAYEIAIENKTASALDITIWWDSMGEFENDMPAGGFSYHTSSAPIDITIPASSTTYQHIRFKPTEEADINGTLYITDGVDTLEISMLAHGFDYENAVSNLADNPYYMDISSPFTATTNWYGTYTNELPTSENFEWNLLPYNGGEAAFELTGDHTGLISPAGTFNIHIAHDDTVPFDSSLQHSALIRVKIWQTETVVYEQIVIARAIDYIPPVVVTPNPIIGDTIERDANASAFYPVYAIISNDSGAAVDLTYSIDSGWQMAWDAGFGYPTGYQNPIPDGDTCVIAMVSGQHTVAGDYEATLTIELTSNADQKLEVEVSQKVIPIVDISNSGAGSISGLIIGVPYNGTATITNNGDGTLSNLYLEVYGAWDEGLEEYFSIKNTLINSIGQQIPLTGSLGVGEDYSFDWTLLPYDSSVGGVDNLQCYIRFDNYGAASTQTIHFSGTPTSATQSATCDPTTYDFGDIPQYVLNGKTLDITVTNTGTDAITATPSYSTSTELEVLTEPTDIAPGDSAVFSVVVRGGFDVSEISDVHNITIYFKNPALSVTYCQCATAFTYAANDYDFSVTTSAFLSSDASIIQAGNPVVNTSAPGSINFYPGGYVYYVLYGTVIAGGEYRISIKNSDDDSIVASNTQTYTTSQVLSAGVTASVVILNPISANPNWHGGDIYADLEQLSVASYTYSVSESSLSFTHTALGSKTRTFTIENTGNSTIFVKIDIIGNIWTSNYYTLTITPGVTKTVTITSTVSDPFTSSYTGTVVIKEQHTGVISSIALTSNYIRI